MASACLLFAVAALWAALLAAPHAGTARPDAFRMQPDDLPLLSHPQQVYEARRYGMVGFYEGGVYAIHEGLPDGYVEYSARRMRLA